MCKIGSRRRGRGCVARCCAGASRGRGTACPFPGFSFFPPPLRWACVMRERKLARTKVVSGVYVVRVRPGLLDKVSLSQHPLSRLDKIG